MTTECCISVSVTKEFKERVTKEAKKQNRTISALIKQLLETHLASLEDTTSDADLTVEILCLQQQNALRKQEVHTLTVALNQTQEDVLHLQQEIQALKEIVQKQS